MQPAQLDLTRGHLFALGALSVAMATLAFFVGVQLGRSQAPEAPPRPTDGLVPDEVRAGDLEAPLARVEERQSAALAFPTALPEAMVPSASDGVPSGGWAIEVAQSHREEDAQRLVDTLRAAELPAYRVASLVDGKLSHRIRVGGYASAGTARNAAVEVASRAGAVEGRVVPAP